ncbi:MAG: hypothetical protein CMB99_16270 [Flavobacteriaceae bacterium]|nr:hypothetical protein [Flavobacteriaceae bacterium]|tara:strand:+ start:8272 stop:8496 length:225 start_codon:yes stop_codon:yes gene_type:complete
MQTNDLKKIIESAILPAATMSKDRQKEYLELLATVALGTLAGSTDDQHAKAVAQGFIDVPVTMALKDLRKMANH